MSKYTERTAVVQAAIRRSRLRREVAEGLSARKQSCATVYSSLGNRCDRHNGHDGPCSGNLAADVFRGFEDDAADTMTANDKRHEEILDAEEARQNIIDAGGF